MITAAQYDALGPLGREIIDHDRQTIEVADQIAARPVITIEVGKLIRERRDTRARLTAGAAAMCKAGTAPGSNPPRTAAAGRGRR